MVAGPNRNSLIHPTPPPVRAQRPWIPPGTGRRRGARHGGPRIRRALLGRRRPPGCPCNAPPLGCAAALIPWSAEGRTWLKNKKKEAIWTLIFRPCRRCPLLFHFSKHPLPTRSRLQKQPRGRGATRRPVAHAGPRGGPGRGAVSREFQRGGTVGLAVGAPGVAGLGILCNKNRSIPWLDRRRRLGPPRGPRAPLARPRLASGRLLLLLRPLLRLLRLRHLVPRRRDESRDGTRGARVGHGRRREHGEFVCGLARRPGCEPVSRQSRRCQAARILLRRRRCRRRRRLRSCRRHPCCCSCRWARGYAEGEPARRAGPAAGPAAALVPSLFGRGSALEAAASAGCRRPKRHRVAYRPAAAKLHRPAAAAAAAAAAIGREAAAHAGSIEQARAPLYFDAQGQPRRLFPRRARLARCGAVGSFGYALLPSALSADGHPPLPRSLAPSLRRPCPPSFLCADASSPSFFLSTAVTVAQAPRPRLSAHAARAALETPRADVGPRDPYGGGGGRWVACLGRRARAERGRLWRCRRRRKGQLVRHDARRARPADISQRRAPGASPGQPGLWGLVAHQPRPRRRRPRRRRWPWRWRRQRP